ncbi:MAG: YbaB/EbfC family nucleoid-associated protein [Planctomycetota bacterium]
MNKYFEELINKVRELYGDSTLREKLSNEIVESSTGGGLVKVGINPLFEVVYAKVDETIINREDKALLERLIVEAVNSALEKAKQKQAQIMLEIIKRV